MQMPGPLAPITIGVDIGNATTSATDSKGGRRAFFPSVIASVGIPDYTGLGRGEHVQRSRHLKYGERNFIIGEEAFWEMGARPLLSERDEPWRRYVTDESLVCFLASIAEMYPEADDVAITLGTGAPLSLFEAHAPAIKQRYEGSHSFTYMGLERKVIVSRAEVFGEGREAIRLLSPVQRQGKLALFDLGGRTLNVAAFNNGSYQRSYTTDFGIERLFTLMRDLVDQEPASRWKLMREMRSSPKAHSNIRKEFSKL